MKLTLVAFAILAAACGSPATPPAGPAPPLSATAAKVLPKSDEGGIAITAAVSDPNALRATAQRLAGLADVQEMEAGAPGARGDAWARHAELMEEIWANVESRHLAPMRSWAEAELTLTDPEAPLYYPFSGPDLPSALQFFPAASSYVLVGLEPPGRIPDLDDLVGEPLEAELERLRTGLKNLAEAGYFVTKRMETDFVAANLEGLLPVLYIFLARAGLTPSAIEFIELDADGVAVPMAAVTDLTATAVRIRFSEGGDDEAPRSLYYFSRDLSNPGLAAAPNFVAFLRGLGSFNTYMKSASYLLHMGDFTAHKDFLAASAGTVLQDDSGIPLRDLPSTDWQLRYFGTYTRTLPTYNKWFQEDLAAVYQQVAASAPRKGGMPTLPFAIGYHSKIGGSCLIWAERR